MRWISLALLALVACGEDATSDAPVKTGQKAQKPPKVTPAATTGAKVFQRDAEAIASDLKRLEKQGRPAEEQALSLYEREIKLRIAHIDQTLTALDRSIQAEARQIVEKAHASLRKEQGELRKKMDTVHRETMEVKAILAKKAKGAGELPPGVTEDELKDRVADLEKEMARLRNEEQKVIAQLDEKIQLLEAGTIPVQGDTVLTKERDVLRALRVRAEKLQQKS